MSLEFERRLKAEGDIEALFDPVSLRAWSVDASIFQIEPLGVTFPKTNDEILKTLKIAKELSTPIIPRGAATGISGGCLGLGIVIDVSKYLSKVLEINTKKEWVRVQPGVVLDDLNQLLQEKGYRLGPETSTSNRATLGGMAANNASGASSIRFGQMSDAIMEATLALPGGELIHLKPLSEAEWEAKIREESPLGNVIRAIEMIQENFSEEIKLRYPPLKRRSSGYNLEPLIQKKYPNLAKLVAGSEGTLGVIAELKLSIVKAPQNLGLALVHFYSLSDALKAIPKVLKWDVLALEVVDQTLLNYAEKVPRLKKTMGWIFGKPGAVLIVQFDAESLKETQLKLSSFEADMRLREVGYAYYLMTNPNEMEGVWKMRKAGLGLLMSRRSYTNACAFIEDLAVPPEYLAPFIEEVLLLLKKEELEAGIYGHGGAGCLHIRPYLNLTDPEGLKKVKPIMEAVLDLVLKYHGAFSGEHGDGLIRSWLNEKLFSKRIIEAFAILKKGFDPLGLLNPGKIVNAVAFENAPLKFSPQTPLNPVSTYLNFEQEGGFSLAADLCNGNGLCRKKEGIMCPSFQATNDEFDSTRARATLLQDMLHRNKGAVDWNHPGVNEALDLCLECKGCKSECPSQVDMAKLKIEFLHHYNLYHGVSFRSRLLSSFPRLLRLGSLLPKATNWFMNRDWVRVAQKWIGLAPERPPPPLAETRFSSWFGKNVQGKQVKGKKVVLFNDTYTEYFYPEVGISAVKILHKLGYEVIVPDWHCCGRPLLSKGRLKLARKKAVKLLATLLPYIKPEIPILGLEPSCLFTLLDEYGSLPNLDVKPLQSLCRTFDSFLQDHLVDGELPLDFKENTTLVKVHGHCHEKALLTSLPTLNVLKAVPGFTVEEIPSGCCGMAGSFGYEKEHYDLSMKIGELKLLPDVRKSPKETLIVANGFSCRTQIAEGAGRSAIHIAEALERYLA